MAYINGQEVLDAIIVKYLNAPTETIEITENGEYDVLNYLKAIVNVAGGGVEITDITLNADGTYTVTDKDNNTHTLEITETDGQITAITYDGDNVPLSFSSGELTGVGDTDIDVSRYPNGTDTSSGYIQTTVNQYLDTGYYCNQNTRFECKYIASTLKDYAALFGDFQKVDFFPYYDTISHTNGWSWKFGGNYTESTTGGNNLRDETVILTTNGADFSAVKGSTTTTATVTSAGDFTSDYSLLLLSTRHYSNPSQENPEGRIGAKLYYFKIYEGNTLVHHFIPYVDENGVVCMKDKITGNCIYNGGTGSLLYGHD